MVTNSYLTSDVYAEIQKIDLCLFGLKNYSLDILREDLLVPNASGNKFRKLKYNILEAKQQQAQTILTFGGAFSNHIAATAAAGKMFGLSTIGVIRGEELVSKVADNFTLSFAVSCGMKLHFVSRSVYKDKETLDFKKRLRAKFGDFYCMPEGGTNELAIKGCSEMVSLQTNSFDHICVAVGTGGTMAGICKGASRNQNIIGFSALKGTFQDKLVRTFSTKKNTLLTDKYCFGGYAKIDSTLVRFINEFKEKTEIQLDPIYTGKMMFGIFDQMKTQRIPENSRILAVHTGGLQGIPGMNSVLKKKNLPLLQ